MPRAHLNDIGAYLHVSDTVGKSSAWTPTKDGIIPSSGAFERVWGMCPKCLEAPVWLRSHGRSNSLGCLSSCTSRLWSRFPSNNAEPFDLRLGELVTSAER